MPETTSPRLWSFPPLLGENARILILGSMPGRASLAAGAYYAHPRNAFWPIMGVLCGFDPSLPYAARCQRLCDAGVALWDVARCCVREGSLDARMRDVQANDFASLLRKEPTIAWIFFNGAKAEQLFTRLVLPTFDVRMRAIPRQRLPSTSPAHASIDWQGKLERWRVIAPLLRRL